MISISESQVGTSWLESDCAPALHGLWPAFRRLDERLQALLNATEEAAEPETDPQLFPGLTITKRESARLLGLGPGAAPFRIDEVAFGGGLFDPADNTNVNLTWLAQQYDLSPFEVDVIVIGLAAEVDLRYEKIFAFLQDDITCKRPTINTVLSLLCSSSDSRQAHIGRFLPGGALTQHNLINLATDSNQALPLLARRIKLDEGVIELLLDGNGLDARLSSSCRLTEPALQLTDAPVDVALKQALQVLLTRPENQRLKLYFCGPRGIGKRQIAASLAADQNVRLLMVDVEDLFNAAPGFDYSLKLVFRAALFARALVYLEEFEFLASEGRAAAQRQLFHALDQYPGVAIIAGCEPLKVSVEKIQEVVFSLPSFEERRTCWQKHLQLHGMAIDDSALDNLAGSFHLSRNDITAAISTAIDRRRWTTAQQAELKPDESLDVQPSVSELFACARGRASHNLEKFSRRIDCKYDWSDLVMPADQLSQLREIVARSQHQHVVYNVWGFGRKLSLGKGINALYCGHPGTGKTMAAEIIANELLLDLYKIDLSQVISKYIGETEKGLNRIFQEARAGSAILFFDEADALFGKRTEVKDSHDRYANIEVSYLLQKMEEYDGIAILATNLRQNIDDAFLRRMQFIVEFPFPDEQHRRQIWEVIFPRDAPLGADVDFDLLARGIRLAGGNLKSIGLAAAFYAAGDGGVIRQEHLIAAAQREFQKLGRNWNERDWKPEPITAGQA